MHYDAFGDRFETSIHAHPSKNALTSRVTAASGCAPPPGGIHRCRSCPHHRHPSPRRHEDPPASEDPNTSEGLQSWASTGILSDHPADSLLSCISMGLFQHHPVRVVFEWYTPHEEGSPYTTRWGLACDIVFAAWSTLLVFWRPWDPILCSPGTPFLGEGGGPKESPYSSHRT